ncbi:hypothetical protein EG68_05109 [Paragonimus skrjabini miyazakii]|uniref:EGF-like domain-containing protein n=1 Tax=Paragonimus skrjabini miyazakii TaxID=59628 RepID=A0A8S9Z1A3_9TREM|nr:hypothetical protein EG68_05109 [Paragonimus skrjabini miyazakii]
MVGLHVIVLLLVLSPSLAQVDSMEAVKQSSENTLDPSMLLNLKSAPMTASDLVFDDNELPDDRTQTAPIENEEETSKPTTFPFIEAIVQRTVNEYMRVIQTQRNWLQRLLQLVREERVIRSKYNCSTDACIYKIQLFTHHLPSHLFHNTRQMSITRRRVRRSVEEPSPIEVNVSAAVTENEKLHDLANASDILLNDEPIAVPEVMQMNKEPDSTQNLIPLTEEDDALRLPEIPKVQGSVNVSQTADPVVTLLENGNGLSQNPNFEGLDKINMERISQEVLTEALSRKGKPSSVKSFPKEQESLVSVVNSDTQFQTVPPETPVTFVDASLQSEGESQPLLTTLSSLLPSISDSSATVVDTSTAPDPGSSDLKSKQEVVDESIDIGITAFPNNEITPLDVPKPPSLTRITPAKQSSVQADITVPAIPFGMNQFVGKPYENCTGRFENYCYNALKCLYISVLETAACYCRTGYTGVRCDMFNLPQTLDILKSFREEVIHVPSLRQPNAVTLYSVVEATARYTVNAVLEEDLLSHWQDDGAP